MKVKIDLSFFSPLFKSLIKSWGILVLWQVKFYLSDLWWNSVWCVLALIFASEWLQMRSGEVLSHLLIEILTGLFSEAPVLDDRLTGYPLLSDLPRNNQMKDNWVVWLGRAMLLQTVSMKQLYWNEVFLSRIFLADLINLIHWHVSCSGRLVSVDARAPAGILKDIRV